MWKVQRDRRIARSEVLDALLDIPGLIIKFDRNIEMSTEGY